MKNHACIKQAVAAVLAYSTLTAGAAPSLDEGAEVRQYTDYRIVVDCNNNGAAIAEARIGGTQSWKWAGAQPEFQVDTEAQSFCRQTSAAEYAPGLHRAALIDPYLVGSSEKAYKEAFSMSNILPMTKEASIGAWHSSNRIIHCLRQKEVLTLYTGPIWSGPHASTITRMSHNIQVPSAFWRVIKQGPYQIAWIIPNSKVATRDKLQSYEATVGEIEMITGLSIPADLERDYNYRPDEWYQCNNTPDNAQ